jgi:hypothetical protein
MLEQIAEMQRLGVDRQLFDDTDIQIKEEDIDHERPAGILRVD